MKGRCRPEPVSTTGAREYRTTHAYLNRTSGAAREALETRGRVQRHQGLQTGGRAHARAMHIDVGEVPSLRSRPEQHQRLQTRVRARAMVMHVAVGRAPSPRGVVRVRRVLQVGPHVVGTRIERVRDGGGRKDLMLPQSAGAACYMNAPEGCVLSRAGKDAHRIPRSPLATSAPHMPLTDSDEWGRACC
jgi:hypothetical protein